MCRIGNSKSAFSRKAEVRLRVKGGDWATGAKDARRPIQLAGSGQIFDQPPMAAVNVLVGGRFQLVHLPAPAYGAR